MSSTRIPMDVLTGLPKPDRSRWQPLRAGILNLFRYDEQIFAFHRGRLLIRGNNGSGKSMALEVLLPFVLDADLAPSRLSTFGGRDRNMYLWLLGFDKTGSRTSERAYVWVEFGRRLLDGTCEYFTAGAMLEGTRASDVKPTYFTTAARIGVEFNVGGPGREPANRTLLAGLLAEQVSAGRPGAVHPDAKTHRKAVNEALYRLPDKRFDALRRTLLQLRRPKLSDKLDEGELDRVLRESLPPVADATVADLAEGFERLDRHAAAVAELAETISHLGTLRDSYRRYARVAVAARADAVAAAETSIEQVRDRATAAQRDLERAVAALDKVSSRRGEIDKRTAAIRGRSKALQDTEAFRQGQDLEPLRELVDQLAQNAQTASERQRRAEGRAAGAHELAERRAVQAQQAAAVLRDTRAGAAAAAISARATEVDAALASLLGDLQGHDPEDAAAVDDDVAAAGELLEELTNRLRPWAEQIDGLHELHRQARDKADAVALAHREVERAEADVTGAEQALNEALDSDRDATLAWLSALTGWAERSVQLTAGQAPPLPWQAETAGERALRWAGEAGAARTRALLARQSELQDATQACREGAAAAARLGNDLARLVELTDRASEAALARAAAVEEYRSELTTWADALVELPSAVPPPDWAAINADALAQTARDWAAEAAGTRSDAVRREQAELQRAAEPLEDRAKQLTARERHLADGGLPELEIPATRAADRSVRPGAPLYLLVEFAEHVDAATRLGVEAATIASGLADAWVSPDGSLQTDDGSPLRDTQLTIAAAPLTRSTLGDVLVPAADATGDESPVPASVVGALLQRIGLSAAAASGSADAGLVVGQDGSWRAGALSGAHRVNEVRLLGAAAREADRLSALARVRAELEELTARIGVLTHQRETLEGALAQVDTERRSVPGDDALRKAIQQAATIAATAVDWARACGASLAGATAPARDADRDDERADIAANTLRQDAPVTLQAVISDPSTGSEVQLHAHAAAAHELAAARQAAAEALTGAADALRTDLEDVGTERAAMPDDAQVRAARTVLGGARTELEAAGRRLVGRQDDERRARAAAELADQTLTAGALGAGLPADTDIPALVAAVEAYRSAAAAWLRAGADTVRATGAATLALRASLEADDEQAAERSAAEDAASKHVEHAERLRALTEDYGDDYALIVDELEQLHREQAALDRELHGSLTETERHQIAAKATAQNELGAIAAARADAEQARVTAQEAFLAAARIGLHAAAGLPEAAPAGDLRADDASAADPAEAGLGLRAVRTWARAVRDAAGDRLIRDRDSVESAANRVTEKRHELEPFFASGGVSIREELRDGLLVLHASSGMRSLPLVEMTGALVGDMEQARTLLAAEEADLFRRFLADDTRREVTSRIRDARTQVAEMARLMAAHPTGSGLRVRLRSVPDERNAPGMQDIVKLMGKDAPLDSEREALSEFFRARVAQVRAIADVDYTAQLAELLDYRKWWRFTVEYRRSTDTEWTALTGKAHGSLSGGEKAVCLHLPLFAAAASYCDNAPLRAAEPDGSSSAGAPRLILLDEVFAGVDEDNRGELFDLIRDLDLDLVATSESEKGLYPQLDGLSIYQLYASDTAVLAARSIWDGQIEHDLLDEDLLRNVGDPQDLLL